jgi:hypothetical protein
MKSVSWSVLWMETSQPVGLTGKPAGFWPFLFKYQILMNENWYDDHFTRCFFKFFLQNSPIFFIPTRRFSAKLVWTGFSGFRFL